MTDHEGMHPSLFQAFGTQANAPASALSQHPDVIIAIYVGLCALVIWAAYPGTQPLPLVRLSPRPLPLRLTRE